MMTTLWAVTKRMRKRALRKKMAMTARMAASQTLMKRKGAGF